LPLRLTLLLLRATGPIRSNKKKGDFMKSLCLAVGLVGAALCLDSDAQVLDERANIPFNFWLGQKVLPAGEYSIYHMASGVVFIKGEDHVGASAIFLARTVTRPGRQSEGKLEFTRYGETYFLSKIWNPNQANGYGVPKTSREIELASRVPSQTGMVALIGK
jgi:hypothetical protein